MTHDDFVSMTSDRSVSMTSDRSEEHPTDPHSDDAPTDPGSERGRLLTLYADELRTLRSALGQQLARSGYYADGWHALLTITEQQRDELVRLRPAQAEVVALRAELEVILGQVRDLMRKIEALAQENETLRRQVIAYEQTLGTTQRLRPCSADAYLVGVDHAE